MWHPLKLSLLSLVFCALIVWVPTTLYTAIRLEYVHSAGTKLPVTKLPSNSTDPISITSPWSDSHDTTASPRRFPMYGTTDFNELCAWSLPGDTPNNNCTLLVSPSSTSTEGLADWISLVTLGFFAAKQTGCRLLLDYGPGIEMSQILVPRHPEDRLYNWTVPAGFECSIENRCDRVVHGYRYDHFIQSKPISQLMPRGTELVGVPHYRTGFLKPIESVASMQKLWPDFTLETGMACALENLLQLSPKASELEPQLLTQIIPTLRDPQSLVFTVYIRTGATDERSSSNPSRVVATKHTMIEHHIDCALKLEMEYLAVNDHNRTPSSFSRIVWMLVTDSPELKLQVFERYNKQDTNARVPLERRRWKDKVVPREIVVTQARGKHTKTKWGPSTADFAAALLDWYLIGESDLVVLFYGYSFGATGALRTARRVYEHGTCSEILLKQQNETKLI